MSQDHKKKLWVLLAIVLAFLLLVPIFFGEARTVEDESGGDTWRNIIYDFQTLFTGILAVGAATFTILQSRKIDEAQGRRHQEMFDLHVRPDKLRLARAFSNLTAFEANKSALEKWVAPVLPEGDARFAGEEKERTLGLAAVCQVALAELSKEELENVRDLFDGDLHNQFNSLRANLKIIRRLAFEMVTPINDPYDQDIGNNIRVQTPMTVERRAVSFAAVATHHRNMLTYFENFLNGFEALAKLYKVT